MQNSTFSTLLTSRHKAKLPQLQQELLAHVIMMCQYEALATKASTYAELTASRFQKVAQ